MTPLAPRIHRYEIPVDDQPHTLHLTGPVLHVAARTPHAVELWTLHTPTTSARPCTFRVYGTGHPIAPDHTYRGTALAPHGLVWHLLEHTP